MTDVGVRLPAHLTASGRAVLAALTPAQVRVLYPDRDAFTDRTGLGPTSPSALRSLLVDTRRRGHATEEGEVTPGFASVAAAVLDHNGYPVAGLAVTYPSGEGVDRVDRLDRLDRLAAATVDAVRRTADELGARLAGR